MQQSKSLEFLIYVRQQRCNSRNSAKIATCRSSAGEISYGCHVADGKSRKPHPIAKSLYDSVDAASRRLCSLVHRFVQQRSLVAHNYSPS